MRFIHIADVHLGASPDAGKKYSEKRKNEIWDSFRKVIEVCRREETDLLLIAGDLFHRQPLLQGTEGSGCHVWKHSAYTGGACGGQS